MLHACAARFDVTGNLEFFLNSGVSNTIPIASNRVVIQKTYFGYQERHNPNLGISLLDPVAESVVFQVLLLKKTKNMYGTFYSKDK